jgi:hypothetical protein
MKSLFVTITAVSLAGMAFASTPIIDGINIDPVTWGVASVAIQDTNTHFGDNQNELNQMFVTADDDNVYIGLTGNLADNNALTIFLDTDITAGSNPLSIQPDPSVPCVGAFPRLLRYYHNTLMEATFAPDYALTISVGIFPGQSTSQLVYACDLTNLNTLEVTVLGIGAGDSGNGLLTGDSGVEVALDNSNDAGVGDWEVRPQPDPGQGEDPTEPTTGIEIAIPRALLGLTGPTGVDVGFFPFISDNAGGSEDPGPCGQRAWGSNQGFGGFVGSDNLGLFNGDTTTLDFVVVPGIQQVIVIIPGVGP